MKKTLKCAVVGCGRIARTHISAIKTGDSGVELSALVDVNPERLKAFGEEYGCKNLYRSVEDASVSGDFDASIICLPHNFLSGAAYVMLENGKHVLAEKPLGVDVDKLKTAVKKGKEKGLVFQAGYVDRFKPSFMYVKEMVDSGKTGLIYHYSHNLFTFRKGIATPWWASKKQAGGFYVPVFASHAIDRILWFKNLSPVSVFARYGYIYPAVEGESEGIMVLSFIDKTFAVISFSSTARGKYPAVQIMCTEKHTFQMSRDSLVIDGQDQPVPVINPFVSQLKEFASAIGEGRDCSVPAEHAVDVLKVIAYAEESNASGQAIPWR